MPPNSISNPTPSILSDPLRQKFVDILKSHGITDEVENVTMTEPPELKGEHMASVTVYVLVEFKDSNIKPKNLFVKKFSSNEAYVKWTREMRIMEKESAFFNEFLPKAREFCKKFKGCESILNFFPKVLYGDDDMIVLENLVLDDTFIMLNKETRQDLDTAKHVLGNLAKFHAANHCFIEEECGGRDKFKEDWELVCAEALIMENNPMMQSMFDNGVSSCMNILKGFPVDGDKDAMQTLVEFLGKSFPLIVGILKSTTTPVDNKLSVLNHGDCWNNNMLFKMDSETGKIQDHIFVDLQITRLGSPNLDIGYFLYTSVQPEVRRAHLIELLRHYFDVLTKTLAMFGKKIPVGFEEFTDDYREKSQLGFFFNLSIIAAIGALKDIDVENMTDDPQEMMAMFNTAIENWVAKNPDKAKDISTEIVAVLKENIKLQARV